MKSARERVTVQCSKSDGALDVFKVHLTSKSLFDLLHGLWEDTETEGVTITRERADG